MVEAFVWNVNPEIFSLPIFGHQFAPRWYGVCFATGLLLGFMVMKKFYKQAGYSEEVLNSGFILFVVGTVVGARVGHCLFYEPAYYLTHPWKILFIWEGGLASHGGTIGIALCMIYYTRKYQIPFVWLCDRLALAISLGVPFIRIGNFFNSEIVGLPTNLPWAVIFERVDTVPRHPAQLYEALAYFALYFILAAAYKIRDGHFKPGRLAGFMLIWIYTARFFIEFIKEDQVDFEKGLTLNMGQILSIPMVLLGLLFYFGVIAKIFASIAQPGFSPLGAPVQGASTAEAQAARKARKKLERKAKNR